METLFLIAILVMSIVIHEVSHGYAALFLGDVTAKYAGRLTLNPIKHIDLLGSIILPGLMLLLQTGFVFGWAKPVPYNPYNLKNQRWGELIVAIAGPLSNILIAIIFGILIRFVAPFIADPAFLQISYYVVLINMTLALFNLMPIPPLDGSKILFSIVDRNTANNLAFKFERYSLLFLLIFIFFLWPIFEKLVSISVHLLTGL